MRGWTNTHHGPATLCEVYRELVEESGWSPEEYEVWLGEALEGQLLSREAPP